MKTKTILILTFLFSLSHSFAQVCGTDAPISFNTYPQATSSRAYNYSTNLCIDVQFHVVRESDGTFAFLNHSENNMIDELNEFYNPHQIFFNSIGINFIDNTNYVALGGVSEFNSLINVDNNPNAINYYIVEELWNVTGGIITGRAGDIPSNSFVIRNDRALTSTAPHEVGHCLDLYHTHETANGVEAISES